LQQACFSRWSLGDGSNLLRDGLSEVSLHFYLQLSAAVRQGHFGIAIIDNDNLVLIGWGFDNLDLGQGAQELVLRIPALPLRPGAYTLMCSLFDGGNNLTGGELVEQWHAVPPLIVDTPPLSHPQDRWAGVLNIPADLQVCPSTVTAGDVSGQE